MFLESLNYVVFYLIQWGAVTWCLNYDPDIIYVTAIIDNLDSAVFNYQILACIFVDYFVKAD